MKALNKFLVLVIALKGSISYSQSINKTFNVVAAMGPQLFIGNQKNYTPGIAKNIGFNCALSHKRQAFIFKPGLSYVTNSYFPKVVVYNMRTSIKQKLVCLSTEVLLKLNNKHYLKAGLFGAFMQNTKINIIYSEVNASYSYSSSSLYTNYEVNYFQAGMLVGWVAPIKTKNNRIKIDVSLWQYATPGVVKDFSNPNPLAASGPPVISSKHYPTVFMLGLEYEIRLKKKETD